MSITTKGNGRVVFGPRNPPPSPLFKMTIDTTQAGSASDTFVLPLATPNPDIYPTNVLIDWGDGTSDTITSRTDPALTHVYSSSGNYQVTLDGEWTGIQFANIGDKLKLSSIDNWGSNQWKTMNGAFNGCSNMVGAYTDSPDTSLVNYMAGAFKGCINFNSPVNFDTSDCTGFSSMFSGCINFNQEVNFDFSSGGGATTYMFLNCTNFDSSVTITNSSGITSTLRMFQGCTIFNSVVTMDTSSVTNMGLMFYNCQNFNQDISAFQINDLTTAGAMFLLSGFAKASYDLLLPAWDAYGTSGVTFHAGTAHYSAGAPTTAHDAMVARGWTITDGGTP